MSKGVLFDDFPGDTIIIEALSDSAAYVEGFNIFERHKKVAKDMKEVFPDHKKNPVAFAVFDSQMFDITKNRYNYNVDSIELEIKLQYASLPNSIKKTIDKQKEKEREERRAKIDSVKIKKLKRYFRVKKDEFSSDNVSWYTPKSAPYYTNRNGVYCYFQTKNGVAENLRFRIQYYADNWLFFNEVKFSIDGEAYGYTPRNVERDNGDGKIWEWFDDSAYLGGSVVNALSDAKSAKMKLVGRQYYEIKRISKQQLIDINRTVELYKAMGGIY